MSASNSNPKVRRGVDKYLAADFAIMMKDKAHEKVTVTINQMPKLTAAGWRRVN